MKMKMTMALAMLGGALFAANPPGFIDDYDAALSRAKAEGKTVLAVFSGSDWCHWCKKLDKEFLSKRDFTEAVTNKLVLLYVDSPSDKSVLSEKARAQNPGLVKKYEIRGYPSVKLLDAEGKALADVARKDVSPAEWGAYIVQRAETLPLAEKHLKPFEERRDALFEAAMKEFRTVASKPLTEEGKEAEFKRLRAEFAKNVAALRKDVAEHEFPAELKADRDEMLKVFDRIIADAASEKK